MRAYSQGYSKFTEITHIKTSNIHIMLFHRFGQVISGTALQDGLVHSPTTNLVVITVVTSPIQCTTRNIAKVMKAAPQLCRKSARLSPAPQTSNR